MTSTSPRLALLLLVPIAIASLVRTASADEPCQAEADAVAAMKARDPSLAPPTDADAAAQVKEGNRNYRVGDFDAAVAAYMAAGKLADEPVILYNLGQSYRSANDYEKAIRQYNLFLDRGQPGPELRALVECHVRTMKAELERAASTAPPQGPAPDGEAEQSHTEPKPNLHPDVPARGVAPWYADGIGWGLAGGGAVLGCLGVLLVLNASDLNDQADAEANQDVRASLRDKAKTRNLWGGISGAVGAAVLVAGVVKLILVPDAPATQEHAVSLIIGPGQIGLAGVF